MADRLDDEEVGRPDTVEMIPEEVRQAWLRSGREFGQRYRLIDGLLTTRPSFNSSPRMRSVPQSRL